MSDNYVSSDDALSKNNRKISGATPDSIDVLAPKFHITHDVFFKLTFALPEIAVELTRNVLPPRLFEKLDTDNIEIQDGLLGESDYFKKSAADLIYVIPFKNSAEKLRVFAILEHKSYSDPLTIFQLTRYCVHVMEREVQQAEESNQKMSNFRFPPIIPIIIHHGHSRFNAASELAQIQTVLPQMESYSLNMKAILFDLNSICVDELPLGTNVPAFTGVLKMMQAIFSRNGAVLASEALTGLRPYSQNPKYQNLIRTLLVYMVRCSKHITRKDYNEIIHNDNIVDQGEKNMMSLAEQWFAEGKEQGIAEGREQGIAEGKEQGIAEGKEQGIAEGKEQGILENSRDSILQVLKIRFGSVPNSVRQYLNEKFDKVVLQSLFESAMVASSLEDFIKEL